MELQRKGRTLKKTVDDLLETQRFKIATELFHLDPTFMRAILIELGNEAQQVAKGATMREALRKNGLDKFELRPILSNLNDFCSYNIYFTQLDEVSRRYYLEKIERGKTLNDFEKKEILNKIKKDLNNEG